MFIPTTVTGVEIILRSTSTTLISLLIYRVSFRIFDKEGANVTIANFGGGARTTIILQVLFYLA